MLCGPVGKRYSRACVCMAEPSPLSPRQSALESSPECCSLGPGIAWEGVDRNGHGHAKGRTSS